MSAFLVSCSDKGEVTHYQEPKATVEEPTVATTPPEPVKSPHGSAKSANATPSPAGAPYHWMMPAGWQASPGSGMRAASFSVPLDGETGDCSLVRLGAGAGAGSILANINRWRGQVGLGSYDNAAMESDKQDRRPGDWKYSYFKIVNPDKPDKAILGSIYQRPDQTLFIKLIASSKGVNAAEADFLAFCDSIHGAH